MKAWIGLILFLPAFASDFSATIKLEKQDNVGEIYHIVIKLDMAGDPQGPGKEDQGGPRAPFLLLDTPSSVLLLGGVPETLKSADDFQALFARYPYGRPLMEPENRIALRIERDLNAEQHMHLNLVVWLDGEKEEDATFIRSRYRLKLEDGAIAEEVAATDSSWGMHPHLNIGDKAPDFDLPSMGEENLRLSDYRGKSNVVLVTYRAFW